MLDDLLNGPATQSQGKTRQIKNWVKQYMALPDNTTIMVSELHCGEIDCPDVETVIAILTTDNASQKIKINKPIAKLSEEDIKNIVDIHL